MTPLANRRGCDIPTYFRARGLVNESQRNRVLASGILILKLLRLSRTFHSALSFSSPLRQMRGKYVYRTDGLGKKVRYLNFAQLRECRSGMHIFIDGTVKKDTIRPIGGHEVSFELKVSGEDFCYPCTDSHHSEEYYQGRKDRPIRVYGMLTSRDRLYLKLGIMRVEE